VTDVACEGLNGMELGDRFLVVQRASVGKQGSDTLPLDLARASTGVSGATGDATRVLQLLNMVSPDELVNDQDYEEILEDIREELGKVRDTKKHKKRASAQADENEIVQHGTVLEVKIPRPIKNAGGRMDVKASESVEHLGKVFVGFEDVEMAKAAMRAVAGRSFGGRTIIAAFAAEEILL
jgi:splicing factor U2AF subunit